MTFDLTDYEDVAARIRRFRETYPSGRLEAFIEDIDLKAGYVLIRANAYRSYEDEKPAAVDYAREDAQSSRINAKWYVENAVTSAYGRVIGLLLGTDKRPTRENMEIAKDAEFTKYEMKEMEAKRRIEEAKNPVPSMAEAVEELKVGLGAHIIPESPQCRHGHMLLKTGVNAKTGLEYRGYVCSEKRKESQCAAVWFKNVNGDWLSPSEYQEYLAERGR